MISTHGQKKSQTLQTALADRIVLPLGQADASNQALHWGLRECSPHSDRHRPDRLSHLAHGAARSKNGTQPPRICPARPRQPHAQTPDQRFARTPAADPDKLKSVETRTILPMNRTPVGLTRPSTSLVPAKEGSRGCPGQARA